ERVGAETGDVVFFGADKGKVVSDSLGALRDALGRDRGLTAEGWQPLWVVEFPMFERDDKGKLGPLHHPFTAPRDVTPDELRAEPEKAMSRAYDMVLNGHEVGGGSIRIHTQTMQSAVFDVLGIS